MIEQLSRPTVADIEALTRLWEASVRATHHFLKEEDIAFYRSLVEKGVATVERLYVTQDASGFTAFMGIEADKIEMLFVDPRHRGRQLGRRMVEYAVEKCGVRKVDVNEQNTQAVGFYVTCSFGPCPATTRILRGNTIRSFTWNSPRQYPHMVPSPAPQTARNALPGRMPARGSKMR